MLTTNIKVKSIWDEFFAKLTNRQAKEITNAISNIDGFAIRKYGYNMGNIAIPLIINNREKFKLNETLGNEIKFYPLTDDPYFIKVSENYNPNLNNGEYIRLYTQIDNNQTFDKLYKTFAKGDLIGKYTTGCYFQVSKENFGNDLQIANPYNIEIENLTSESPSLLLNSQYYSKVIPSQSGSVQATPFTNWDYIYPYWSINMIGKTTGIKFELYEMSNPQQPQLYGNGYAYPGGNYQGNNYMGQMYNNGGNKNKKIKISYM